MSGESPDSTGPISTVEELRARLEHACDLEAQAKALTERLTELEVRRIEADMEADRLAGVVDVPRAERSAIGQLLEREHALEQALRGLLGESADSREEVDLLARLQVAAEALRDWQRAPEVKSSRRVEMGTRIIMLVLTVAGVWGAYAFHWAIALLLIPVIGPLSALLNRGDDTQWLRIGAQRRFDGCHITPPVAWEKADVAKRLAELDRELEAEARQRAARAAAPVAKVDEEDASRAYAELSVEQVEVQQTLAARLRRVALVDADLTKEERLSFSAAGRAAQVAGELERVTVERTRLAREAGEQRDRIWRVLNDWGATEGDSSASLDSLRAGLERLVAVDRGARPM